MPNVRINVILSDKLAKQAMKSAEARQLSRSQLISILLTDYVRMFPPGEPIPKLAPPTWKRARAKAKR